MGKGSRLIRGGLLCWVLCLACVPTQAEEVTLPFRGLNLIANLELGDGQSFDSDMILLLHGLQGHHSMEIIKTSQELLLEEGYGTLAINLSLGVSNRRGFFECDGTQKHGFSDAAAELHAWIEWLKSKGVRHLTLMAHSLGATQALFYLHTYPDNAINRLVLLSPATRNYHRLKQDYLDRYGLALDPLIEKAELLVNSGKGRQIMQDIDFFYCPKTRVAANTFYDYYRKDSAFSKTPDYVRQTRFPTLVIAGSVDERQPDVIPHLAPLADGKRIRLRVIENAGHFFRDLNIEEAIEIVTEFLQT